ncbi:MAG: hypothetical protein GX442_10600 [Candidatus Riflebacteria bacterium]|nr:hypothetical protein [Candidatus Riflebacteria bacterium]
MSHANGDPRQPVWVERAPTSLDGQPTDRLLFIFRAVGCTYARRPEGGCTMCGFTPMTLPAGQLTDADLIAQFDSVFADPARLTGIGQADLYMSGSFLADDEMPPPVRDHVFRRLAALGLRRVLIESRPEFITAAALREAAVLPPGVLEVGIGLESADDHIREVLIRKGFGRAAFEQAAAQLARAGARLLVNVLLKPLGVTDDAAAVADAVATGRYVFDLARRLALPTRVALQPVFVAPGTPLEREFLASRYQPPSLWSVVAAVRGLHPLGETTVGLSDEGLEPHRAPAGCPRCDAALRTALREFNRHRSLAVFDGLSCPCQKG